MYKPYLNKELLTKLLEQNLTLTEIGKRYDCSRQFLARRAKSLGVVYEKSPVKYPVKRDYFDSWSHEMAYTLGFIMADGCVNVQENRNAYRLKIEVQLRDIEVLQFIRDQISPTRPIQDNIIRLNDNGSVSYVACLNIAIKKDMFNRLGVLGVVPKKSGKEKIPKEIPTEYLWTFILGYFDGDGCIYYRGKRKDAGGFDWSICSLSKKIIKQLKKIIPKGKVQTTKLDLWRIVVRDKPNIIKLRSKLYKNAPFFLKRKHKLMKLVRFGIQKRIYLNEL